MLLVPGAVGAQTPAGKEPSHYDKIWNRFTEWYRDDSNPVIQRVLLSGRFQYEYVNVDADQGNHAEWNVRRLRIGPRITLFKTVTVHTEVDLDPQDHDPFYLRFTDCYVQWARNARLALTIGKQSVPFTIDGATSSRELLTIDRSNLANNLWFPDEYMPGLSVSGRRAAWTYRAGVYSAGAKNREFGEFNGGPFTLTALGYDFASRLGVKEALVTGNYVYQHPDRDNTFTRPLEHVGSINIRLEDDRWGVRGDLSAGAGYLGQSDLWALQAMPFANVTPKFQIVGRYTYITSDSPKGVRLATYESRVVTGRGDEYNEFYAGANYYFYGHKLKLQTGVQFADMNDRTDQGGAYSGVAWTTGLRVGW